MHRDEPSQLRIGAIVLAAGGSSRYGSPKQLVIYEGSPLVRRAAEAARDAGADPVVVVLGADAEIVAPALASVRGIRSVVNDRWQEGMSSSIACGLHTLLETFPCDGVLITLADQPLVDAKALKRMLDVFDDMHPLVAAEYEGIIGVPAIFAKAHFDALLNLHGDSGAGTWLRNRTQLVTRVSLQAAALDMDTQ